MHVRSVLETCLYATDLEAAERFYTQVLGLTFLSRVQGRHVFFRCGEAVFLVFNPAATSAPGFPPHGATGPGHVAFRIPSGDFDAWRDRLEGNGVDIETEVDWPRGGHSIYFRDPAGNSVELATAEIWGLSD
ncbi:MAG: glyoxalase/bleomycin resistance/extradiol dioxygenase family protein [Acidobacteria bacterium]|nr:MAG: glyoxalase/bleomycin resistance/extradiol dioxygenase family protein [Acidobacteriota bacterium]